MLTGPTEVTLAGPVAVARAASRTRSRFGTLLLATSMIMALGMVPLLTLASLFLLPARGARRRAGAPPAPRPCRPWARLTARLVDVTLLAWAAALPFRFELDHAASLFNYVLTLGFVPLEAVLLSTAGTTPGKWLFGFAVVDTTTGRRPRFRAALRRAALVWTFGLAVGFPLRLATTVVAHRRVTRARPTGTTSRGSRSPMPPAVVGESPWSRPSCSRGRRSPFSSRALSVPDGYGLTKRSAKRSRVPRLARRARRVVPVARVGGVAEEVGLDDELEACARDLVLHDAFLDAAEGLPVGGARAGPRALVVDDEHAARDAARGRPPRSCARG